MKYIDQTSLVNYEFDSESFNFSVLKFDGRQDIHSRGEQHAPYIAINYAFEGLVTAKISDKKLDYTFEKNQANMIFLPESEFEVTFRKGNPVKIVKIYFDQKALLKYVGLFESTLPDLARCIASGTSFAKRKNKVMIQKEREIIRDMIFCPFQGDVKTYFMEAKMIELWSYYAHSLDKESIISNGRKLKDADYKKIRELRDFLDTSYAKKLTLSGLSKQFATNEFKIKTGFKELYNTSVFQYINDLKMDEAKWLLLEGYSCSEVAGKLGYSYANYFSTRFKEKFGMSPREFLHSSGLKAHQS